MIEWAGPRKNFRRPAIMTGSWRIRSLVFQRWLSRTSRDAARALKEKMRAARPTVCSIIGAFKPDRIQAACSVFTAAIAFLAYTAWSEQEGSKERAAFAMEVLRSAHSFEQCFHDLRTRYTLVETDIRRGSPAVEKIFTEAPAILDRCEPTPFASGSWSGSSVRALTPPLIGCYALARGSACCCRKQLRSTAESEISYLQNKRYGFSR